MLTTVMGKFCTKISDLVRKALKSFAQISNPHFPEIENLSSQISNQIFHENDLVIDFQ